MPQGLIEEGHDELNTLAGYNDDGLAVVFSNQSFLPVTTHLQLNPALVDASGISSVQMWVDNDRVADLEWGREGISITIQAQGIAAVFLKGARLQPGWSPGQPRSGLVESAMISTQPGDARAMLLSLGANETWAYVYLREDDSQWRAARLAAESTAGIEIMEDNTFPFEFSFPVSPDSKALNMRLEATTLAGEVVKSEGFKLVLDPTILTSERHSDELSH